MDSKGVGGMAGLDSSDSG